MDVLEKLGTWERKHSKGREIEPVQFDLRWEDSGERYLWDVTVTAEVGKIKMVVAHKSKQASDVTASVEAYVRKTAMNMSKFDIVAAPSNIESCYLLEL